MPTCQDCQNFKFKDDLMGYCMASEDKLIENDRSSEDCIANCFTPKEDNAEMTP
ncbi:MAG TPA: hypothetical protein VJJ80_01565 [Patescibacteria group bacterium]|nr:hypothetical protein [Patescibacteria group bacterium]